MDKYKVLLLVEDIKRFAEEGQYDKAMEILQRINVNKLKKYDDLVIIVDVYIQSGKYVEAKKILENLYTKSITRRILTQLIFVSMQMQNFVDVERYYEQYVEMAPNDVNRYIFRYKIDKIKGADIDTLIGLLEELKSNEYIEEWAYELAKLYYEAGQYQKAIKECESIILWFSEGKSVEKAKLLREHCMREPQEDFSATTRLDEILSKVKDIIKEDGEDDSDDDDDEVNEAPEQISREEAVKLHMEQEEAYKKTQMNEEQNDAKEQEDKQVCEETITEDTNEEESEEHIENDSEVELEEESVSEEELGEDEEVVNEEELEDHTEDTTENTSEEESDEHTDDISEEDTEAEDEDDGLSDRLDRYFDESRDIDSVKDKLDRLLNIAEPVAVPVTPPVTSPVQMNEMGVNQDSFEDAFDKVLEEEPVQRDIDDSIFDKKFSEVNLNAMNNVSEQKDSAQEEYEEPADGEEYEYEYVEEGEELADGEEYEYEYVDEDEELADGEEYEYEYVDEDEELADGEEYEYEYVEEGEELADGEEYEYEYVEEGEELADGEEYEYEYVEEGEELADGEEYEYEYVEEGEELADGEEYEYEYVEEDEELADGEEYEYEYVEEDEELADDEEYEYYEEGEELADGEEYEYYEEDEEPANDEEYEYYEEDEELADGEEYEYYEDDEEVIEDDGYEYEYTRQGDEECERVEGEYVDNMDDIFSALSDSVSEIIDGVVEEYVEPPVINSQPRVVDDAMEFYQKEDVFAEDSFKVDLSGILDDEPVRKPINEAVNEPSYKKDSDVSEPYVAANKQQVNAPMTPENVEIDPDTFCNYYEIESLNDNIKNGIFNVQTNIVRANFVIMGPAYSGRTTIARMIAKQLFDMKYIATNKIARIDGEVFNRVNLNEKASKLLDSCIIIQNAECVNAQAYASLLQLIAYNPGRLIVFLETSESFESLLGINGDIGQFFSSIVRIPRYKMEDLIEFAHSYAAMEEFYISDTAEGAIRKYINNLIKGKGFMRDFKAITDLIDGAILAARARIGNKPVDVYIIERQDIIDVIGF